jgi:hypothetical protein
MKRVVEHLIVEPSGIFGSHEIWMEFPDYRPGREAKRQHKRARQRRQTHAERKRAAKSVEAGYVSRRHRWQSMSNEQSLGTMTVPIPPYTLRSPVKLWPIGEVHIWPE